MRIHTFYHGRFSSEPWAWTDYRPASIWIVIGGYALAVCWGGDRQSDPYGPAKAKPSAK